MQCNVGGIDRMLRIIAGVVLIGAGIFLQSYWIAAIGAIPLLTGAFKFCPLYPVLGMDTSDKKEDKPESES